jgi:hypothetical protein
MVPRDRIELPTRGFSDQIFENSKMSLLQAVDSIPIFQLTFGFVWNHLEMFDLDGHNLGTTQLQLKWAQKKGIFPFFPSRYAYNHDRTMISRKLL